jgi:hypothetical protein
MKARSAWIFWLVVAGCSSSHPLEDDGGTEGLSGPTADAGADRFGSAGGDGADAGAGAPDCGPPEPYIPCRTDADCGNPYLVCLPTGNDSVTVCRDPDQDAGINPACPSYAVWAAAPLCPTDETVTSPVCQIRYQRQCTVDTDCGPAGFTCTASGCSFLAADSGKECATAADCPTGWLCYVDCPCPGTSDTKTCIPPFAVDFGCGAGCISDGGVDEREARPRAR